MGSKAPASAVKVDEYQPQDRTEIDALFRRVFGESQADASARRWTWQYARNPHAPEPQIWIARDGIGIIGQYPTMPVRLSVAGQEIEGSWGTEVMVAPERQRQGVGEILFQTWDRHSGASLGMGLSRGSHQLFRKLKWPDVGPVPCLVKPLSAAAFLRRDWPRAANRLVSIFAGPLAYALRSRGETDPAVQRVEHFDGRFTDLWDRVSSKFDFAVRRDADYLEWKYINHPQLRYSVAAMQRHGRIDGYAVFRHIHDADRRLTALVDFLADPDDPSTLPALMRFMEDEARTVGSHKVRTFVMNATFRRMLQARGYFRVASTVQLVAKINAVRVGPTFYTDTAKWHVTFGDSDQDR